MFLAVLLGCAQAETASSSPSPAVVARALQPLDVAAPLPQGRWSQATAVLQESPGVELTAAQALLQPQWRILLPRTEYDFLDAQPHWIRLPLINSGTTAAAVWLQINYPWLRDARVQLLNLQGEPLSPAMRAGAGVPIDGRALRTALPSFPITLAPGQEAVLMVRTEGTLWWPDRLQWVTAAEGAQRTTLQTAITALALGATLVLALVMALQRTAGGMAAGLWISITATAEVVNIGHVALLPWLDSVVVPLSAASVLVTTLSHACLALMTFTLLGLHQASWTPRKLLAVVLVGLGMVALVASTSDVQDRIINLPIYLVHGAGWAFLVIAWRAQVKQAPLVLGLIAILHLNWLISHGWPHGYGRLISETPEVRLSIKVALVVLLVLAYAQQSARQRRALQQSLLEAQQRQNAELEQLVAQRTHELRLALNDATQANQAKSQFISGMSHELRTPMNAILGFSQLMAEDARADAGAREGAREIHQAGRHLLHLIDDVLDLSKIELGRMDVRIASLAVAPLVRECCDLIQPQAKERQVSITCEGLDGVMLQADEGRLRQVVLNLLSNAVKYNHVGGWVRVSAEQVDHQHWRLAVQDGGPGISPEALARLFQPFERGDARFGPVQGTGIGLALSQRLIHLMNGRIGVHSEPGHGARFWVELPGGAPATEPASSAAGAVDSTSVPMAGLQRPHAVLCVDDNPVNLKLLVRMLQREPQLQVHTCQDSHQALEQALEIGPSLILLDINMPGLDGYQLLTLFRQHPSLAAVPVVAVTADAMKHDVDRGREAGFADYLTKPLELGALRRVLSANMQIPEARA
jgi:signal transduction histidine kinase/ActR/RegA family two-component response regulator